MSTSYPSFPRKPVSPQVAMAVLLVSIGASALVTLSVFRRPTGSDLTTLNSVVVTMFSFQALVARPLFWVVEEIVFRGFLLQVLRRKFPLSVAMFVTAVLFALEHFGKGASVMALAFGSSYYFSWLLVRTESLYAPIIAHCSFDIVALYVICPLIAKYGLFVDGRFLFSCWWYLIAVVVTAAGVWLLLSKKPIQAPEPAPGPVTPRALE